MFDGATPEIKLAEIRRRRERRDKIQSFKSDDDEGVKRLARRLLIANLKKQKELEKIQSKSSTSSNTAQNTSKQALAVGFHLPTNDDQLVDSATLINDETKHNDHESNYEALVLSDSEDYLKRSAETLQPIQMNDWNNSFEECSSQNSDTSVEIPFNEEDIDIEALASVPSKMRVDIIEKARIQQRLNSRKEFMSVAANPVNYSQCQLRNFLKSSRLNQKVTKLATLVKGDDGLEGERIASDASKRFVFTKESECSVENGIDDCEILPKRVKEDILPMKGRKRLRKNKSDIDNCSSDDSDNDFVSPQSYSKLRLSSRFLEEEEEEEEEEDVEVKTCNDDNNKNYQVLKAKTENHSQSSVSALATESSNSESIHGIQREAVQINRLSPIEYEGGGFLRNDTASSKGLLKFHPNKLTEQDMDDSSSDEEVEIIFSKKIKRDSETIEIDRSDEAISVDENHAVESEKSEEDVDWEDCETDENHIHDINARPESTDSEKQFPPIMTKPVEVREGIDNLLVNDSEGIENRMFRLDGNDSVESEKSEENVDWEDCQTGENQFIHGIDAQPQSADSEPQVSPIMTEPLEAEERIQNTAINDLEGRVSCAEGSNRGNQWWNVDESMQRSEQEEDDQTESLLSDRGPLEDKNVTSRSANEKLNVEAIERAQETASNLTDWAGRAVRRALATHIRESNIKTSEQEDDSISNASDSSEPVYVPSGSRSPKHAVLNIDTSLEGLQKEDLLLREEYNRIERDIDTVTDEMVHETMQLLTLFGIPYLRAPAEAESQCVELERLGLVDGVVTEDSDALVFGCKSLYKNIFDDKKYVEAYLSPDAEKIGIGFNEKIALAMLLGGDYTQGVTGVGIVNGMEILKAFGPWDGDTTKVAECLKAFRKWMDGYDFEQNVYADNEHVLEFQKKHRSARSRWILPPDFPAANILQAYSRPVVDSSNEKFSWDKPDIEQLRDFLSRKVGWNSNETDRAVLPVLSRTRQTRLDGYFMRIEDEIKFADVKSKRLREVWKMPSQEEGTIKAFESNNV